MHAAQAKITCVIAVASAITKGTFAKRANVFARSVLPVQENTTLKLPSNQHCGDQVVKRMRAHGT
jgi:hypothetical protein